MWKPIVRCSLVGGIVVFLWMTVSWMVLPMHQTSMNKFTDESEVTSCVMRYAPSDGIYAAPSDCQRGGTSNVPFIFLNIRRGVDCSNMVPSIICGVITTIIGAALITYLLLQTKGMKYWGRVWFVTLIALIVGILGALPALNWWHFPANWVILEIFDLVVGWFLGGLVIAKLAKHH